MLQVVLVLVSISAGDLRHESELELPDLNTCLNASNHVMQIVAGDWRDLGFVSFSASCVWRVRAYPASENP